MSVQYYPNLIFHYEQLSDDELKNELWKMKRKFYHSHCREVRYTSLVAMTHIKIVLSNRGLYSGHILKVE